MTAGEQLSTEVIARLDQRYREGIRWMNVMPTRYVLRTGETIFPTETLRSLMSTATEWAPITTLVCCCPSNPKQISCSVTDQKS